MVYSKKGEYDQLHIVTDNPTKSEQNQWRGFLGVASTKCSCGEICIISTNSHKFCKFCQLKISGAIWSNNYIWWLTILQNLTMKCFTGPSLIQPQRSNPEFLGQVWTHHSNFIQIWILNMMRYFKQVTNLTGIKVVTFWPLVTKLFQSKPWK